MDFDWLREQRSGLGTAAVIVMDQSTDIIKAIWRLSKFYKHESCGQCTPCREGTGWMMRVMDRLVRGEAEVEEIDMLLSSPSRSRGTRSARLAMRRPGRSRASCAHFREEIEDRIKAKRTGRMSAVAAE
jgi:NADH-quinone oxidoreductase subunit F